ncbi:ABC transporter permease [Hoeflea alexandrii]|jgi:peptide/nickel transport system permease protein|uniref:ABC transporter permease subunit n=1 Tax=Hoeflea alexandrii TaxID=288436 RepID=A0ABT1CL74_9HYPH|nr:ABC transporter permease [Hoeflea alexandrii]MCO6406930.1 ABC transporter permease subunit [Hoeflea alexandrii]MCY0154613.1 ABC transporter permease [Hoeflea alexandrii]
MLRYIVGRLLAAVPIFALVGIFIFSLVHLMPGDPAVLLAGDNANPKQVEKIRERLHLDQPVIVQFGIWAGNALQLDLGDSVYSNQPVTKLIAQRIEPTMMLAVVTLVITVLIAVPLGVIAAWRANGLADRLIMAFAVLGFSLPVFVIGYLLVYVFAVRLKWFPVQGYKPLEDGVLATLHSLTLPSVALALVFAALIARVTRASMLEALNENYTRTARAKGLGTFRILVVHALKSAGVPVITVIGIGFATLVGGVVVTESVFNIPGIGRLTVDAITRRDYPVVQGVILFFSALLILINLLVDLSYALFDPRVKG